MIEIRINKDVGSYEAKFIGPFTMRQSITLLIALPICYGIYYFVSPLLGVDAAGFLICIPASVAVLFGWIKPYGMPMEKFIRTAWVNNVLAPSRRKYKSIEYPVENGILDESPRAQEPQPKQKKTKFKIPKTAVK